MVLNKYIGGSWCEGTTGDIFTGGNVMDSYFGQKQQCKFKMSWLWICFLQTCSFSLHNKWTDGLEWCGLLIQTLILTAPIHCRGWRNKPIYILDGLRVSNFQLILFFGWTKKELIYSPSFLSTQHHRSNFLKGVFCQYYESLWYPILLWTPLTLILWTKKVEFYIFLFVLQEK